MWLSVLLLFYTYPLKAKEPEVLFDRFSDKQDDAVACAIVGVINTKGTARVRIEVELELPASVEKNSRRRKLTKKSSVELVREFDEHKWLVPLGTKPTRRVEKTQGPLIGFWTKLKITDELSQTSCTMEIFEDTAVIHAGEKPFNPNLSVGFNTPWLSGGEGEAYGWLVNGYPPEIYDDLPSTHRSALMMTFPSHGQSLASLLDWPVLIQWSKDGGCRATVFTGLVQADGAQVDVFVCFEERGILLIRKAKTTKDKLPKIPIPTRKPGTIARAFLVGDRFSHLQDLLDIPVSPVVGK